MEVIDYSYNLYILAMQNQYKLYIILKICEEVYMDKGEEEIEITCINCDYLEGTECSLERAEDYQDGKDCPMFIPWWKV